MIRRRSKKRAKQEREYAKLRKEFLEAHPFCAVKTTGCQYYSAQVHHKAGRTGELLTDVRFFLEICDNCHRVVELNPTWAKHMGYSVSRLAKVNVE